MWGKIYKVIYIAAFLFVIGVLIYALFIAEEKDPKLISKAAVAYKMLGDEENAEKYCRMYGVNGGDAKELRATLAKI